MQAVQRLFLFSVLLATGACLECSTCRALNNCTGSKMACTEKEDACAIIIRESELGSVLMMRTCAYYYTCEFGDVQLTYGKERTAREIRSCCKGNDCTPKVPQLLQLDRKENGRTCPGCFAFQDKCTEETVNCTGSETLCVSFNKVNDFDHVTGIVKGCTTESSCASFVATKLSPLGENFIKNIVCRETNVPQAITPTPPMSATLTSFRDGRELPVILLLLELFL